MAHITLSIPDKLKQELVELKEVNWSEVARVALSEKVKRQRLFRGLERLMASEPESEASKLARRLMETPSDKPLDKESLSKMHNEMLKTAKPPLSEEEFEKWAADTVKKGRKGRFEELKKIGLVK